MIDELERPTSPPAILSALLRGNERFRAGQAQHPRQGVAHREAVALGQQPVAAVLTCADSRVAPEFVFDQGLGDLYVVRVAGNAAADGVVGGLEFAVEATGVGLVLVMGHTLCAAVAATLCAVRPGIVVPVSFPETWQSGWLAGGTDAPGQLEAVLAAIRPALSQAADNEADPLTAAVDANVLYTVAQLKRSPLIAARLAAGRLGVAGVRYDLASGRAVLLTS